MAFSSRHRHLTPQHLLILPHDFSTPMNRMHVVWLHSSWGTLGAQHSFGFCMRSKRNATTSGSTKYIEKHKHGDRRSFPSPRLVLVDSPFMSSLTSGGTVNLVPCDLPQGPSTSSSPVICEEGARICIQRIALTLVGGKVFRSDNDIGKLWYCILTWTIRYSV